jgi:GNAT superfamily N-acetyltransferase
MKAEFIALTAANLDRAIAMMSGLYQEMGAVHDGERARRATLELMANPSLGGVWLMEIDGETAGYLCVTLGYSLEFDGRFALLDELYVGEQWRSKGMGAQAIAFAQAWGRERGLAAIRLEVSNRNLRAIELYRRHGFKAHERYLMTKWV